MFVYIDESGNLTAAENQQHFVLAALLTKDKRIPKKIIRRAKKRGLPKKLRHLSEIKGRNVNDRFLKFLFEGLRAEAIQIGIVVTNTEEIPKHLRGEGGLIYLRLSETLLKLCKADKLDPVILVFDKKYMTGIKREGFNTALREKFLVTPKPKRFEIYHDDSTAVAGLQIAHFIAWSTYQKYQHNKSKWYDAFSPKIAVEEIFKFEG